MSSAAPPLPPRSWLARLFRLPVLSGDGVLPFVPDPPTPSPEQRISVRPRQRVAVVDGTLDGAILDDLDQYVGRDLVVTVSTPDAVQPGDIVVTRATSGASISALHAVGDVTVVSLIDRSARHDAQAIADVPGDGIPRSLRRYTSGP